MVNLFLISMEVKRHAAGEEFSIDEFGNPTMRALEALFMSTVEEQPPLDVNLDVNLNLEMEQFKVPG